jgi:DNA-directed RNA polymerase subunit M/transcription elongation factor TFIIS
MTFCPTCENLLVLKVDTDQKLHNTCLKCGFFKTITESCVISTTFCNQPQQHIQNNINKYTKYDPTLPRIKFLDCPKKECKNHTDNEEREIIYVRYDNVHLKYVYICPLCDSVWESDKN